MQHIGSLGKYARASTSCAAALMLAVAGLFGNAPASADTVSDFYTGKTVTIMVPAPLDGVMGLYSKITAKALERFIPGKPRVRLESMTGGGGEKGTAYAYAGGPRDGTMIALVAPGSVTLPGLRKVAYDVTKFHWLGSAASRPSVIWLWDNAPVETFDDAKKIHLILGSTGRESGTYIWPTLINHMLGTRFRIVTGYRTGGWIDQAAEQGEVHGRWTPYSDLSAGKQQWLQRKIVRVLLQIGPHIGEQPDVPRLGSLVGGEFRQMVDFMGLSERVGMGFWVRPGVPRDRIAGLRQAFISALSDSRVVRDARKRGAVIAPIAGHKIDLMVAEAYKTPPEILLKINKILGVKKTGN